MRVLDLFSGIGGFSLGLERAGMRTIAFCEIDPFCQAILRKHWPDVPVHGDIRTLRMSEGSADVICGGFPCQDISTAGRGAGIEGERSGLWSEYARLIGDVRPRFVIVENVAALLGRGIERVLGDLASLGYDAEWHCIPASAVGAPHRRDRIWIIAYASREQDRRVQFARMAPDIGASSQTENVADAIGFRQSRQGQPINAVYSAPVVQRKAIDAFNGSVGHIWSVEPNVGRVANGVPRRVDRLKSLGNAVVPQIPEIIGRSIMSLETGINI